MTPEQRARCVWRRCYKLVSLLHTNRAGKFFLYGGLRVTGGEEHEAPVLYDLVEEFVRYHGPGVMKRLLLDRRFLDGAKIGHCKKDLGIEVLIPVRRDMDIYHDGVGMAEGRLLSFEVLPAPPVAIRGVPLHRPERIRKREEARQRTLAKKKAAAAQEAKAPPAPVQYLRSEVATVEDLQTFTTCPVPLHAVVNREIYSDGRQEYWVLLDTARISHAVETRDLYRLRTSIEERHRQLKCFSDLERFFSRAFSLVVNQVVFILLMYSLLQWYWLRIGRPELLPRSRPHALAQLRPALTVILIYYQNYVARLSPLHYQELLLTLRETARRKILSKTRRLRRGLAHQLDQARAP